MLNHNHCFLALVPESSSFLRRKGETHILHRTHIILFATARLEHGWNPTACTNLQRNCLINADQPY
jgi:hypothetical protein